MKTIGKLLLSGLLTVLPLGVTIYVIWWLGTAAQTLLGRFWRWVLPESAYSAWVVWLLGFAVLLAAGLVMRVVLARRIVALLERWVAKIPLVKTVYGSVKDLLSLFSGGGVAKLGVDQVVLVPVGDASIRVLGLVTRTSVPEVEVDGEPEALTAVYVPMSYGIGGYTLLVRPSILTPVHMGVEQALRFAVTGGAGSSPSLPSN